MNPLNPLTSQNAAPLTTAHQVFVFGYGLPAVYQYDVAEDGPECELITRILARHPLYIPGEEKRRLDKAAREVRTL